MIKLMNSGKAMVVLLNQLKPEFKESACADGFCPSIADLKCPLTADNAVL